MNIHIAGESQVSGECFIQRMQLEVLTSLAVEHPYLEAIANGNLANFGLALKDFAYQYGLYTAHFTKYVSAVLKNTAQKDHREILLGNLEEELGNAHDVDLPECLLATVVDQPHKKLFQRFQTAVGVDKFSGELASCEAGADWSKRFLKLCKRNQYVGIGAIGIGTEFIVSKVYQKILKGLRAHTKLTPEEHVFFDLHSECDDEHAEQIAKITKDLLLDAGASEQIEYGIRQALALRESFWDAMLERAVQPTIATKQMVV